MDPRKAGGITPQPSAKGSPPPFRCGMIAAREMMRSHPRRRATSGAFAASRSAPGPTVVRRIDAGARRHIEHTPRPMMPAAADMIVLVERRRRVRGGRGAVYISLARHVTARRCADAEA